MPSLGERIADCAYRHWKRAGMTEWPTVRQVARRLHIRHSVFEECDGEHFMLTGYNCDDFESGDFFVEASTPAVEADWCAYWMPYSRGCFCGNHIKGSDNA
jgi:hypothetical protein